MMAASAMLDALLGASLRPSFVIVAVGAVLWLLRTRAGSIRHAAWTAVVIAMLAPPFVPQWLPAVPIAMPAAQAALNLVRPSGPVPPVRTTAPPTPAAAAIPASLAAPIPWLSIAFVLWLAGESPRNPRTALLLR